MRNDLKVRARICSVKDCSRDLDHALAIVNDGRLKFLAGVGEVLVLN